MKVVVIIPAAGLGTRMGAPGAGPAKQFTEIDGVPILIHTLRRFTPLHQVSEILIAMRPGESGFAERVKQEGFHKPIRVVEGGEHRQQSVANALAEVNAGDDDVVLVHDAVRPFVDREIVENVIGAAARHGAAIAGVPAVDTVKQVDRTAQGAIVIATIPRERVVLAQTPQGFRFGVIRQAFQQAASDGYIGTDEASLVERNGQEVAVVMGSARNIKITSPGDLELAEFFLSLESRRRVSLTG